MDELNLLLKRCREFRYVYIYGDGEVGRLMRVYLHEHEVEVLGFLTTYKPKKDIVMGIPVCELKALNSTFDNTFIIICMNKKWWNEATELIIKRGYTNYMIIDDRIRLCSERDTLFSDIYEDVDRKINVLLYHRIENMNTSYSIMVNERNFENQLRFICSNYNVLRCDADWSNVDRKSVALTFDDGYVDFYTKAYPLLKKYNVPATVFVSTGGIDNDKEFWWDKLEALLYRPYLPDVLKTKRKVFRVGDYRNRAELIMDLREEIISNTYQIRDEEIMNLKNQINPNLGNRLHYRTMNSTEIRQIAKDSLITIGAHTINHILCDFESEVVQKKEIQSSKTRLEEIIDKEVNLFAYPNGNIGTQTRRILNELGFIRAFTCEHACIDRIEHPYDIPRSPVLNWDSSCVESRFRAIWQTGKDI